MQKLHIQYYHDTRQPDLGQINHCQTTYQSELLSIIIKRKLQKWW